MVKISIQDQTECGDLSGRARRPVKDGAAERRLDIKGNVMATRELRPTEEEVEPPKISPLHQEKEVCG